MLVDGGDFKAADDALSRLNKVSADCTVGRLLSAKMYLKEGNYEKVSWEAGRLLKNEPSNVQALLMRGEAFFYLEVFITAHPRMQSIAYLFCVYLFASETQLLVQIVT